MGERGGYLGRRERGLSFDDFPLSFPPPLYQGSLPPLPHCCSIFSSQSLNCTQNAIMAQGINWCLHKKPILYYLLEQEGPAELWELNVWYGILYHKSLKPVLKNSKHWTVWDWVYIFFKVFCKRFLWIVYQLLHP